MHGNNDSWLNADWTKIIKENTNKYLIAVIAITIVSISIMLLWYIYITNVYEKKITTALWVAAWNIRDEKVLNATLTKELAETNKDFDAIRQDNKRYKSLIIQRWREKARIYNKRIEKQSFKAFDKFFLSNWELDLFWKREELERLKKKIMSLNSKNDSIKLISWKANWISIIWDINWNSINLINELKSKLKWKMNISLLRTSDSWANKFISIISKQEPINSFNRIFTYLSSDSFNKSNLNSNAWCFWVDTIEFNSLCKTELLKTLEKKFNLDRKEYAIREYLYEDKKSSLDNHFLEVIFKNKNWENITMPLTFENIEQVYESIMNNK